MKDKYQRIREIIAELEKYGDSRVACQGDIPSDVYEMCVEHIQTLSSLIYKAQYIVGTKFGHAIEYFETLVFFETPDQNIYVQARTAEGTKTKVLDFLRALLDEEGEIVSDSKAVALSPEKNRVFIVHGRDDEAKHEVARFVEKLKLKAIILHEQNSTGRTIIEKLEHFTDVDFALVLLTPDDIGGLKNDLKSLRPRARQNVILELGYLMGKLGRPKVCALVKGNIEKPADYDGVVYILMDENEGWKKKVLNELLALNIPVKIEDFGSSYV